MNGNPGGRGWSRTNLCGFSVRRSHPLSYPSIPGGANPSAPPRFMSTARWHLVSSRLCSYRNNDCALTPRAFRLRLGRGFRLRLVAVLLRLQPQPAKAGAQQSQSRHPIFETVSVRHPGFSPGVGANERAKITNVAYFQCPISGGRPGP